MAVPPAAQYHVLAVDDSLLDRKLIERLLKISSYQVTTVDSGNKALEFLGLQDVQGVSPSVSSNQQEIEVNLIITDYCMPGMTGYDLLKRIKESAYLKDIPVVVMSSENIPSRINRCLEEGAEEFFLKPVKLSDMKKLGPHLLKAKSTPKEQKPQPQHRPHEEEQLILTQQQPCSQQQSNHIGNPPLSAPIPTTAIAPKISNSNKRKVMDGGISPETTRPSYKDYGLTAAVV